MTTALPPDAGDDGRPIMEGLAALPVFFNLKGKRVALAGGSPAALWKAELAQAAGAEVDVYAAEPCAGLIDLARRRPSVRLARRAFQPDDLKGAALAIADVDSAAEAEAFRAAARASRRARQHHRQAGLFRFPVRRDRRSFAARHRHFERRRLADPDAGAARTHRSRAARRHQALGRGRQRLAGAVEGAGSGAGAAPPLLGAVQRQGARRRLRAAGRRALRRASGAGSNAIRARRRAPSRLSARGRAIPSF